MKRILLLCLLITALAAAGVLARVPQTMSYQGVLKDDAGVIVPNDNYDLTFRVYNVETNGSALWTEEQTIYVSAGIVNAVLGAVTPIALDFDEQYWLGVTIGVGDELSPRTLLTGVPYALNAQAVLGTHNVFPDSGSVGIGTTDPGRPLHVVSNDLFVMEVEGTRHGSWATLSINGSSGGTPCLEFRSSDSYMAKQYVTSAGNWYFDMGPDCVMYAKWNSKNVGIGHTDPAEKLDVDGAVRLGTTDSTNAGTIRWTGADFEGYDGGTWQSLTSGGSGSLPPGSLGQTIRHNGSNWIASNLIYNDGTKVGIGTTNPLANMEVVGDNIGYHFRLSNTTTVGPSLYLNAANKDWVIYGTNPAASAGDRKFIIRDYSAATDRLIIDENGYVGINEINPTAPLNILGGNWDLNGTDGDLKIGDDACRLKIGVATDGLGAGTAGIRMQGGLERLVLGAGLAEVLWIENDGTVSIGSEAQTGELELYRYGSPYPMMTANTTADGGSIFLKDEDGYIHTMLTADTDGTGGHILVKRDSIHTGIAAVGNWNGSGEPRLYAIGSTQSASFSLDQTGDNAVQLPGSSINATEIFNEAGCASTNDNCEVGFPLTGGGVEPILARSITVPSAGCVLAVSTMQVDIAHTSGSMSTAAFGVSEYSNGFASCQDVGLQLYSTCPSGTYQFPVSNNSIFTIPAEGTYTYYLVGYEISGNYTVYDCQLSLVFIPTVYGLVSSPPAVADASGEGGTRPRITEADINAERQESIYFNNARIERELAELRAQVETLKREMEQDKQRK